MSTDHSSPAHPVAPHSREMLGFNWRYWNCNIIEMWERLAYYTLRPVAPIYIAQATEPGGLHLPQATKGWIYMWWALFQSFLPMFTGGYADRYGYKKTLAFSITMNIIGYLMMAAFHNYYGFFAGIIVLAIGTAFFKPSLQATLAHNLTKANSSLGWGIFYWVVNVGSFVGHYITPAIFMIYGNHDVGAWRAVFLICAGFTAMNYILLFTYTDVPSGASKKENPLQVFGRTIGNVWPFWFEDGRLHPVRGGLGIGMLVVGLALFVFADTFAGMLGSFTVGPLTGAGFLSLLGVGGLVFGSLLATWLQGGRFYWQLRLPVWLLIMACFWLMMYQLWDLQPNYIEDWVDSSMVANTLQWEFLQEEGDRGLVRVPQQILISLNALLIVLFMIPVSWAVRKMRTLSAMFFGMIICTLGVLVAGLTGNGWVLLLGILMFSLGEMLTGPKKNEYLGLIAPPGKKGLYLGYVNIPVGVGVGVGSYIAGFVYGHWGEKATLALKYLATKTEWGLAKDWDGRVSTLEATLGVPRTEAFAKLQEIVGIDGVAATQILWETYNPQYMVWIPFAAIGVIAATALYIYGQMAKRWKDMNV